MTELWVTSTVVVSWALAAGLVGIAASLLAQRLGDRLLAMRVAREHFDPTDVEQVAPAESDRAQATTSTLALAGAGGLSFADR